MEIKIRDISFSYQKEALIESLNVTFYSHQITSIIGSNGSGKSTLLMLVSKILAVPSNTIYLNDKDVNEYSLKEYAKSMAVVHQKNLVPNGVDVKTIVGYGRIPYLKYHQSLSEEDYQIIDWAMATTNITAYANVLFENLSGGQQQRVWLAMALAQKTPILLLDEPTTYLDVKYQIEILNLIRKINIEQQMTIIMVHHDINQASHYSHQIVAMKKGSILFAGNPKEVISTASLKELYEYDLDIIEHNNQKIVMNYQKDKSNG